MEKRFNKRSNPLLMSRGVLMKSFFYFSLLMSVLSAFGSEKTHDKKRQEEFQKSPISFMEAAYMDYHNGQIEQGLKKTQSALKVVQGRSEENPDAVFNQDLLKGIKVHQVESSLHVLQGVLMHKKGTLLVSQHGSTLEKNSTQWNRIMMQAFREMEAAIDLDPKSAVAHYQYAKLLRDYSLQADFKKALNHFEMAAKLSKEEQNEQGHRQAMDAILEIKKSLTEK